MRDTIFTKIIVGFLYKPFKRLNYYLLFLKDFSTFKKLSKKDARFSTLWKDRRPQLLDKTPFTNFDTHYIYHPAWAARIVRKINPEFHIDISSTLIFSSMLSAFIPVKFYDYRLANIKLSNLTSETVDLTCLPFKDNSIASLSCMHTIEHIGLGRYGDTINPNGDLKAINELKRVLAKDGNLLFVVPIGKPKVQFNAHRIYSYAQIVDYFKNLELVEFSLIPDNATEIGIITNATQKQADEQNYGCGCFWFKK
mgnify:CR=1 FL=1